jgi:hypothetical protein
VARYRLRYQATDLEMPIGEFVIGRSSACNLALDDALVSRRHAIIHVTDDTVTVEDLGSRNGVLVNGERIAGKRQVRHLDRVTIGGQDLVVIEIDARRASVQTGELVICDGCGTPVTSDQKFCPKCGLPTMSSQRTLSGATLEMKAPFGAASSGPDEVTKKGLAFNLLTGIADKALALGRYDEAERILGNFLSAMLDRAREGSPHPPDVIEVATRYSLRLAEGLSKARWVDWVFQIHDLTARMMTAPTVEALHGAIRKVRYQDPGKLRAYLTTMRARAGELSANERFLLKRLEGIERLVGA